MCLAKRGGGGGGGLGELHIVSRGAKGTTQLYMTKEHLDSVYFLFPTYIQISFVISSLM